MIEYLEKLVEDKEYPKALDYAEQLLLNPENTPRDLMLIYSLVLPARCETGEFYGAQVAGQLAIKMARELEAWDRFGSSALWLGVCFDRLGQPENALAIWYDYLAHLPRYSTALKHHAIILYNIGLVQGQIGQHEESLLTLQRAAEVANSRREHRKAHGIQHALIKAHLQYGELKQIPPLLAKCAYYLRHHPSNTQSFLWHLTLRVRYALATKRPMRAIRVAERGLSLAKNWADVAYEFHILLARVHEQLGDNRLALEEAVQARSAAMRARRFDMEFHAADYMYGLLSSHPSLGDYPFNVGNREADPSAID